MKSSTRNDEQRSEVEGTQATKMKQMPTEYVTRYRRGSRTSRPAVVSVTDDALRPSSFPFVALCRIHRDKAFSLSLWYSRAAQKSLAISLVFYQNRPDIESADSIMWKIDYLLPYLFSLVYLPPCYCIDLGRRSDASKIRVYVCETREIVSSVRSQPSAKRVNTYTTSREFLLPALRRPSLPPS